MNSLRSRLLISLSAVTILAVLTFGVLVERATFSVSEETAKQQVMALAKRSATEFHAGLTESGLGEVSVFSRVSLPPSVRNKSVFLQVWDHQGKSVYRSESLGEHQLPYHPHPRHAVHFEYSTDQEDSPLFLVWITFLPSSSATKGAAEIECVPAGTGASFTLATAVPAGEFQQTMRTIRIWVLVFGLLVCGAVVISVVKSVAWAMKPVADVETDLSEIDEQSLAGRLSLKRVPHELRSMVETINRLLHRLESAFQREKEFTADAAHELRTPISAIKCTAEIASSQTCEERSHGDSFYRISKAAEDMQETVENLLTLSRFDRGMDSLQKTNVCINSIIAETIDIIRPLAEKSGVSIIQQNPEEKIRAVVDRYWLSQAILNLLQNAVQYNKLNGQIIVAVSREKSRVFLSIKDTGIGIPESEQDRIFERFYRVDPSRTRSGGGSGLGLSIVKWVAETHNGSVQVRSVVSEGSEFILTLPDKGTNSDS